MHFDPRHSYLRRAMTNTLYLIYSCLLFKSNLLGTLAVRTTVKHDPQTTRARLLEEISNDNRETTFHKLYSGLVALLNCTAR